MESRRTIMISCQQAVGDAEGQNRKERIASRLCGYDI